MKLSVFFQRLEAAVLLVAMVATYHGKGFNWLVFLIGFFAVDISMVGYLISNRMGAIIYNLGHTIIGPLVLLSLSLLGFPHLEPYGVIWLAHIAIDRMFGYGLKEVGGFKHTHLGHIGQKGGE